MSNESAASILDLLPEERECCGTFKGSYHRATCPKYRGKFKPTGPRPLAAEGSRSNDVLRAVRPGKETK